MNIGERMGRMRILIRGPIKRDLDKLVDTYSLSSRSIKYYHNGLIPHELFRAVEHGFYQNDLKDNMISIMELKHISGDR